MIGIWPGSRLEFRNPTRRLDVVPGFQGVLAPETAMNVTVALTGAERGQWRILDTRLRSPVFRARRELARTGRYFRLDKGASETVAKMDRQRVGERASAPLADAAGQSNASRNGLIGFILAPR